MKSPLIRKDPDAGEDWRQEEMGTTEDKMVGRRNWLNRHKFEQTPHNDGQRSVECCSQRGHKQSDMADDWKTTSIKVLSSLLSKGFAHMMDQ